MFSFFLSLQKLALNRCGLCGLSTDAYDGSGKPNTTQPEKFVACSECLKSFHPACLKFNTNMMQSVKKYNWLCVDCKKCVICGNSENDVIFLILNSFLESLTLKGDINLF